MKISPTGQEYDLTHEWAVCRADLLGMEVFRFDTRFGRLRVLAENEDEARRIKFRWEANEEQLAYQDEG